VRPLVGVAGQLKSGRVFKGSQVGPLLGVSVDLKRDKKGRGIRV
jgi:hypothetical protein